MDNSNEMLKEKSSNADNSKYFVFFENDFGISKAVHVEQNPDYIRAIEAKNTGNDFFKHSHYNAAVIKYTEAIKALENQLGELRCPLELSNCYHNRATAKNKLKQFSESISDATKAITLNKTYAKAYFRRYQVYLHQKKFYLALQDIVQACVFERFKNKTFNEYLAKVITEIDGSSKSNLWEEAYNEMGTANIECNHCIRERIDFMKKCDLLAPICVPVLKHQPIIGYTRAMVGLRNGNIEEIIAGCNEEEASKGKYLIYSFILRGYVNSVCKSSHAYMAKELPKDLINLDCIITDKRTPKNVRFYASLCRITIYFVRRQFDFAYRELTLYENDYNFCSLFHLIKSGALLQLALTNKNFYEPLKKCCTLYPNIYEIQFQKAYAESKDFNDGGLDTVAMTAKVGHLIKTFPNELAPRLFFATIQAVLGNKREAKLILKDAKKDFPARMVEMYTLYGLLNSKNPTCVKYFTQSLEVKDDDPNAITGLIKYFENVTFEYAKSIEVSTKALSTFLLRDDFMTIFNTRHAVLKKIIDQNFWDKL